MTIEHNTITDPDIHEPKGVASAGADKVYVSNNASSGDWKYPAGACYADLYIDVGATSQTLNAIAGTFDKLNPTGEWHEGTIKGCATTPASGLITLTNAGTYLVDFWITFTSAAASGTTFSFKYAIDGVVSSRVLTVQKPTAGTDKVTCAASGLVNVTAGQTLSIYAASTAAGTAITVNDAGITAVLLQGV